MNLKDQAQPCREGSHETQNSGEVKRDLNVVGKRLDTLFYMLFRPDHDGTTTTAKGHGTLIIPDDEAYLQLDKVRVVRIGGGIRNGVRGMEKLLGCASVEDAEGGANAENEVSGVRNGGPGKVPEMSADGGAVIFDVEQVANEEGGTGDVFE